MLLVFKVPSIMKVFSLTIHDSTQSKINHNDQGFIFPFIRKNHLPFLCMGLTLHTEANDNYC